MFRKCLGENDQSAKDDDDKCNGNHAKMVICSREDCELGTNAPIWGGWESNSECSVTCGNGTMAKLRRCEDACNSGPVMKDVLCMQRECLKGKFVITQKNNESVLLFDKIALCC